MRTRLLVGSLVLLAGLALSATADEPKPPQGGGQKPAEPESKWAKHWRERVEKFKDENAKLDPAKRYAVFVGDSLTEGFPLEKHFAGKAVLNRGIVADGTGALGARGISRRLEESVFGCRPAVVFLQIGVNDLASSPKPPQAFVNAVAEIVDAIKAKLPKVPVVLATCYGKSKKYARWESVNPRIVTFNEGILALAKERKLPVLDLAAAYNGPEGRIPEELSNDGLHLKRDQYGKWAELARAFIP